jgi:competence protein ComEC
MSDSDICRYSLMLDGVDADFFDGQADVDEIPPKNLALMRIVTTERRLIELTGREELPQEGEWLQLVLSGKPGDGPPIWLYSAENDYAARAKVYVSSLEYRGSDAGPAPVGAAVVPAAQAGKRLRQRFDLSQLKLSQRSAASRELAQFTQFDRCIVQDVGQANLCRLESDATDAVVFVDIGEPAPFHFKTMPKKQAHAVPKAGLVIITHWDWDHVAAGKELRSGASPYAALKWIAPAQVIGPNAYERIARPQHNRNRLLLLPGSSRPLNGGALNLLFGSGTDQNNAGIAVIAKLGHRQIFLPGDACISTAALPVTGPFDGVVVSHHGAASGGTAPTPASGAMLVAAVSVGKGNRYGHPDKATLAAYRQNGWQVVQTDLNRQKHGRGDIVIK